MNNSSFKIECFSDGKNEVDLDHLLHVSGSGKIRRPPNSFMLFAREHRRKVSREHPNETNKSISTILGLAWHNTSAEIKAKYYDLAKRLDIRHKRLYPDYSYNPKEARLRKKKRLRQKGEKTTEQEGKKYHHMVSTSSSQLNAECTTKDNTPFFKQEPQTSESYAEGDPANEDCDNPATESAEIYKPPDLSSKYPLIGAMDDPVHLLPDTTERMRNMAGATSSGDYNPGNEESPCTERDSRCGHQHFMHAPHWTSPPLNPHYQYHYGRRFDPRIAGHSRDGFYPTDPSGSYHGPHGYGNGSTCPCGHCPQDPCYHMMKGYPNLYPPYLPHKHPPYYPMVNDPRLRQNYFGPSEHFYIRPQVDLLTPRFKIEPGLLTPDLDDPSSSTGQFMQHQCHDHTYHQHAPSCIPYHGDTCEPPVEPIALKANRSPEDTDQFICVEEETLGSGGSIIPKVEHPDDVDDGSNHDELTDDVATSPS